MVYFGKSKNKQMTLQPKIKANEETKLQIPVNRLLIESDDSYSLNPLSKKLPVTPRRKPNHSIKKKIDILDQLGFGGFVESKAESNLEQERLLKRRFSIGIIDFWTGQDREKFLRENGYLEAYKKIKEETMKIEMKGSVSTKKAGLPYLMDSNARRRIKLCVEEKSKYQKHHFAIKEIENLQYSARNSDLLDPYEILIEKCDGLAKDTVELKQRTEVLKTKIREVIIEQKQKSKISKRDRDRINLIINSL